MYYEKFYLQLLMIVLLSLGCGVVLSPSYLGQCVRLYLYRLINNATWGIVRRRKGAFTFPNCIVEQPWDVWSTTYYMYILTLKEDASVTILRDPNGTRLINCKKMSDNMLDLEVIRDTNIVQRVLILCIDVPMYDLILNFLTISCYISVLQYHK